jgi:hypothetical protein
MKVGGRGERGPDLRQLRDAVLCFGTRSTTTEISTVRGIECEREEKVR